MKKALISSLVAALAIGAASGASAAVIATVGGDISGFANLHANFQANTSLANNYVEDGLLFRYTGFGNNAGCGFEGFDCYDDVSEIGSTFSGNYFATNNSDKLTNAYVSIRRANGLDFKGVSFAVGSGYMNLHGYWQTYNDAKLTGSGNFSSPAIPSLSLYDNAGFDEVRYFAFSTAGKKSGTSAPAIDEVHVDVPEPASILLFGAGVMGLVGMRRKQKPAL